MPKTTKEKINNEIIKHTNLKNQFEKNKISLDKNNKLPIIYDK